MTDWYQQALLPPEVIEVRIRVGIVPETNHAQALAEVFDPMTGVLMAQWSIPHMPADRWWEALHLACAKAEEQLGDVLEPF